ncbi:transferrin-like isoform X2 [Chelonus insularis]|nr:transferrin-like isoform X2 [Chelonus insularis]
MILLVTKNIKNFNDLEEKRLCHPGYDSDIADWTRTFADYFHSWIFARQCNSDKTLLGNDISSLSKYFQAACIAGPWTFDAKQDSQLKTKYRNLCALCENPIGCYSSDKYHGREGALLCLTDNVGDAAWVRLQDAITHFQAEKINKNLYNYLCPDGSSRPMIEGVPCVWITKPWPVIAARRGIVEKVAKKIKLLRTSQGSWKNNFLDQLENYHVIPVNTDIIKTPGDYLTQYNGFASAYSRSECSPSRTIKWCVASNLEDRKCQQIRDLAFSYGIVPKISCYQRHGRDACIEAVHNGDYDFFIIKPEEMMKAEEKNLVKLLELISKKSQDLNTYGILVKNDSKYHTLEDLEGAHACFTKKQSIEWNAFIVVMRNRTKNPIWYCSNDNAVTHFFQRIILNNQNNNNDNNDNDDNDIHNNGLNEESISIENTYECLTSGKGDVAFVNLNTKNDSYRSHHNLRSICIDKKSNDCILTWTTLGTIVVNANMTEIRRDEIRSMLMELNVWFGSKFAGQASALSLYGPFDSHRNVIFSEKTQSLQDDLNYVRLPRSYENVLKQIRDLRTQKTLCNKANSSAISRIIFFISYLIIFINFL